MYVFLCSLAGEMLADLVIQLADRAVQSFSSRSIPNHKGSLTVWWSKRLIIW